jgi:VTC domain
MPPTVAPAAGPTVSPSLIASSGLDLPAFELKFLLTEAQALQIVARVAGRLTPDPHGDPARGHAYDTTSVYCDTARLDVFHRLGPGKRRKHRVRRYSASPWIFLERKIKWGDRVKKQRTPVADSDLELLLGPVAESDWSGAWFQRHLQRRQLLPVCAIAYERAALVGQSAEGPLRLTFDRNIRGTLTNDWRVAPFYEGTPILPDEVICEFKYQTALPALFKEIIQAMHLTPSPVSKYRTFLRTSIGGRPVDA